MVSKEMWWYRTKWWERSFVSINRQQGPMRWFHFTGRRTTDWSDADLWTTKTLANVLGHFGMAPRRIPNRGYRFRSAPTAEFDGAVSGSVLRPEKFLFVNINKPSVEIGVKLIHKLWNGPVKKTRKRYVPFVKMRNRKWDSEFDNPGSVSFPPIEFDIHRRHPVHVHLHAQLSYFIEGNAEVRMGRGHGYHPGYLKMRLPQYDLVSV